MRPTNKFIGVLPLFNKGSFIVSSSACPITKSTNSVVSSPAQLLPRPAAPRQCQRWRWHILNILCLLHISIGRRRTRYRYRRLRLMTLELGELYWAFQCVARAEKARQTASVLQAN